MKKYKKRRFVRDGCIHVYQRSVNGFNLFYDSEDFIVFYTIVSVLSKHYKVRLMGMCLMIDHVHILVSADSIDDISSFVRHFTSLFVLEFNHDIGRKGPLFHKSFGSAPKQGGKKIRSAIVYVGNNPVEKNICDRAEQYRWNFLAYLDCVAPFSEYIPFRKSSGMLKKAMKEVRIMTVSNRYLTYAQVRRLLGSVDGNEREFLIDYMIAGYYPFDKDALLSYYDSVEDMRIAMKSTAGSEYDIKEQYYSGTDVVYYGMMNVVRRDFHIEPVKKVIALPLSQKIAIARFLQKKMPVSAFQILKFLHLKPNCDDV